MASLADWFLELDGRRFEASWPEAGDVTSFEHDGHRECGPPKLSFGVTVMDLPELKRLVRKPARLVDVNGHEVARIRLEKVDPDLKVAVATWLPQTNSEERETGSRASELRARAPNLGRLSPRAFG